MEFLKHHIIFLILFDCLFTLKPQLHVPHHPNNLQLVSQVAYENLNRDPTKHLLNLVGIFLFIHKLHDVLDLLFSVDSEDVILWDVLLYLHQDVVTYLHDPGAGEGLDLHKRVRYISPQLPEFFLIFFMGC
jgi:hypothetical protein